MINLLVKMITFSRGEAFKSDIPENTIANLYMSSSSEDGHRLILARRQGFVCFLFFFHKA